MSCSRTVCVSCTLTAVPCYLIVSCLALETDVCAESVEMYHRNRTFQITSSIHLMRSSTEEALRHSRKDRIGSPLTIVSSYQAFPPGLPHSSVLKRSLGQSRAEYVPFRPLYGSFVAIPSGSKHPPSKYKRDETRRNSRVCTQHTYKLP